MAGAAAVSLLVACGGGRTPGPIATPGRFAYFPRLKVGSTITDGAVQLIYHGTRNPVIDEVRDANTTDGFELIGAMVAGPRRKWGVNEMVHGYPPTQAGFGPITDAVGAVIPAGDVGVELLLGLKIVKGGYQVRQSVDIDYHIGTDEYTIRAPVSVINCPSGYSFKKCSSLFSADNW
ncbi:MAG: hypothetical protein QM638_18175 [Nocardioides sp.]|uniref:hypothetical protein n=1 Tax=Nocardioides sp. TaxID=35761 RepID=UPI0039E2581D